MPTGWGGACFIIYGHPKIIKKLKECLITSTPEVEGTRSLEWIDLQWCRELAAKYDGSVGLPCFNCCPNVQSLSKGFCIICCLLSSSYTITRDIYCHFIVGKYVFVRHFAPMSILSSREYLYHIMVNLYSLLILYM